MDLAVLVSSSGTILQALIEAELPIGIVVADRPCGAEAVAARAGIAVKLVRRSSFGPDFDRQGYTDELVGVLQANEIGLVAMAGFGTVLSASFFDAFDGRVVNTHPALLPAFRGWHAVEAALEAGVPETGCTVHLATATLDDGPILAQEAVAVLPGDTVELLHERIKQVERRLYPAVLRQLMVERSLTGAS